MSIEQEKLPKFIMLWNFILFYFFFLNFFLLFILFFFYFSIQNIFSIFCFIFYTLLNTKCHTSSEKFSALYGKYSWGFFKHLTTDDASLIS